MSANDMANLTEMLFSFYGLVVLRVTAPPATIRFLRSEWRQFEINSTDEKPHVEAFLESMLPTRSQFSESAGSRKLGGWYKGCFWRTNFEANGDRMTVHYRSLPRSNILFKDSCLEPFVLAKLQSRGLYALHASSFCIGERAWALCGPPSSGKTMVALVSAGNGQTLLSDDITIFGGHRIHPYLVPPRVYAHWNKDRNTYRDLVGRWIAPNSIRDLVMNIAAIGGVRIPARIGIPEKSPSSMPTQPSYRVGGFFFLKRITNGGEPLIVTLHDKGAVLREVLGGPPVHGASLLTQLIRSNIASNDSDVSAQSFVEMLVDQGRCLEVRLPRRMRVQDWKRVHEKIVESAEELD